MTYAESQILLDTTHLNVDGKAGCGIDVGKSTMIHDDPTQVDCTAEGCAS